MSIQISLVFCLIFALALSAISLPYTESEEDEWNAFKTKYGKNYITKEEDHLRKNLYFDKKLEIAKHNELYAKGIKKYKLGINKFADMASDELEKFTKCHNGGGEITGEHYVPPKNEKLPSSVDWRQKGAVTPVKDQQNCYSCWAFSSTGAIEGQHFLKTGKLVSLSEQNLVDCSNSKTCETGGLMDKAFDYVKNNNGIDTEESYPYTSSDSPVCRFKNDSVGATVTGYKLIKSGDESALQSAVANVGPISVAIDASGSFFHYKQGIYHNETCGSKGADLDHAVLIVGYGSENGEDYWLVKNSWGEDLWGMKGYAKMARYRGNMCGIATYALYPLV